MLLFRLLNGFYMKLMFVLNGRHAFASRILPFLIPRTLQSEFTMAGNNDAEITVLTERLTKAEKRLKLLTREITDIKTKLFALQSTETCRFLSTSAALSAFNDDFSTDGFPEAKRKKPDLPMEGDYVVVYTDGACENNGKSIAKAGIGVWFSDGHPYNISEPVKGRPTNNTAEIQAVIAAVKIASKNGVKKLCIKTDSQFLISSMTQWIHRWKRNSWKIASGGPVKNKEDFVQLDEAIKKLESVKWIHVNGHSGIKGNEEADRLARLGAERF